MTAAVVAATLLLLRDDPALGHLVDRRTLDAIERSIREPMPAIGWALLGTGVTAWIPVAVFTAVCLAVSGAAAYTARETYRVPLEHLGRPATRR